MNDSIENVVLTEAVYYILLSLLKPLHGYGIMLNINQMSNGRVNLAPGTLYGAISALLEKEWIKSISGENDSRKKEYVITDMGKHILSNEVKRLKELIYNGETRLGGV